MEVLISAFIMAVGLLGVAALLPVGYHEANSGAVADRAALIGQQAFRDFRIRGIIPKAQTVSGTPNEPMLLPRDDPSFSGNINPGRDHYRYRSGDDDRYTWLIWASREPYNPDKLKPVRVNNAEGYQDSFSDRYLEFVPPQLTPVAPGQGPYPAVPDNSLVRVVVFVFHQEQLEETDAKEDSTKNYAFEPESPERCPMHNRPVAVFQKVMRIDRDYFDIPNRDDEIMHPDTTLWGLGLEN
jgi:hypothetical protein